MRWRIKLNEYDYSIIYKKGCVNTNADALSRNPVYICKCLNEVNVNINAKTVLNINAKSSSSRGLEKMCVWPDMSPVTDFAMSKEPYNYRFFDYENENTIASVFLACEKTEYLNHFSKFENLMEVDRDDKNYRKDETNSKQIACSSYGKRKTYSCTDTSYLVSSCPVNGGYQNGSTEASSESKPCVSLMDFGFRRRKCVKEKLGNLKGCTEAAEMEKVEINSENSQYKRARNPMTKVLHSQIDSLDTDRIDVDATPKMNYSKDKLHMRNDNLINFASIDGKISSKVTQELIDKNKLSKNKIIVPDTKIGDALGSKYKCSNYTFNLIIKNSFNDIPDLINIETAIKSLKIMLDDLKITSFSVSKTENDIDCINWFYIENLLKKIFNNIKYKITICSGDIMIPVEFERANIIKEYHESLVGGH